MPTLTRRHFLLSSSAVAALGLSTQMPLRVLAAEGGTLRAALDRDVEVLDPGYMIGGQEMAVQYAIFPRLAELDLKPEGVTWKPSDFVKRLELVDPKRLEFELKPGLKWTNNFGDVTAEDVKYSYERMKGTDWGKRWGDLDHVEVTGPLTGALVLKNASAPFMVTVMCNGIATIVSKAAVEALPEKKFTLTIPASCGPYVISDHVLKQKLVLSRNPDWTGTKPQFDTIEMIVVENGNAAGLAFEAGELDILGIDSKDIPRYKDSPPPNGAVTIAGNLQYAWVGMNTEHPKLTDIRVRQAIQRAVNVDQIQKVAYKDVSVKAGGLVPPGLIGHRDKAGYPYDVEAAKKLMAEAGVTGLELNLVTLSDDRARVLAAQVIQENLAQIGITVKVLPLDSGAYWSLGRESKGDAWKDSQMWIMRFGGNLDPSDYFQWFTTEQKGNWNWERQTSKEFDTLYDASIAEIDPEKRKEMYFKLQEMLENTGAYVWLNHEPEAFLNSTKIKPAVDPSGVYLLTAFGTA